MSIQTDPHQSQPTVPDSIMPTKLHGGSRRLRGTFRFLEIVAWQRPEAFQAETVAEIESTISDAARRLEALAERIIADAARRA